MRRPGRAMNPGRRGTGPSAASSDATWAADRMPCASPRIRSASSLVAIATSPAPTAAPPLSSALRSARASSWANWVFLLDQLAAAPGQCAAGRIAPACSSCSFLASWVDKAAVRRRITGRLESSSRRTRTNSSVPLRSPAKARSGGRRAIIARPARSDATGRCCSCKRWRCAASEAGDDPALGVGCADPRFGGGNRLGRGRLAARGASTLRRSDWLAACSNFRTFESAARASARAR